MCGDMRGEYIACIVLVVFLVVAFIIYFAWGRNYCGNNNNNNCNKKKKCVPPTAAQIADAITKQNNRVTKTTTSCVTTPLANLVAGVNAATTSFQTSSTTVLTGQLPAPAVATLTTAFNTFATNTNVLVGQVNTDVTNALAAYVAGVTAELASLQSQLDTLLAVSPLDYIAVLTLLETTQLALTALCTTFGDALQQVLAATLTAEEALVQTLLTAIDTGVTAGISSSIGTQLSASTVAYNLAFQASMSHFAVGSQECTLKCTCAGLASFIRDLSCEFSSCRASQSC